MINVVRSIHGAVPNLGKWSWPDKKGDLNVTWRSKLLSIFPPLSLLQFFPPGFCLEFLPNFPSWWNICGKLKQMVSSPNCFPLEFYLSARKQTRTSWEVSEHSYASLIHCSLLCFQFPLCCLPPHNDVLKPWSVSHISLRMFVLGYHI